jgi:hypothetical protein
MLNTNSASQNICFFVIDYQLQAQSPDIRVLAKIA